MRRAVETFLAFLLRHAADDGENLSLARIAFEMLQAIEDLLFGFIADAAGVARKCTAPLPRFRPACSLSRPPCQSPFPIEGIHLAAESFDVKGFFHGRSL
jgi:hypothetical protein